ncbi:CO(2)-response secreted protease-like [Cicer arietinum]|uniref:CO(2)-response secreted protease-like n=1 Tax=Cicer arietinum TaxID=3827 RepID=A0A1S2Z3B1_CICAR|nr:CO(2)-response secreted protease-like [Cicer arietinum]
MEFLLQLFFLASLLICNTAIADQITKPYVVYMGNSSPNNINVDDQIPESVHLELLSSIIPSEESERIALIHHYSHAFSGFSAMLTHTEASALSGHDGVVSVFPDPILQLHTTRSWDFLDSDLGMKPPSTTQSHSSTDIIIGLIDTGIWPESPSFRDEGIGKVPSRWKGVCMEGHDFKKSDCNRKLIGARYYNTQDTSGNNKTHIEGAKGSPRDSIGHGTHTSSTAAGVIVKNASYYGLAKGTARGGSPSTRIAAYKTCSEEGCSGSTILKAIDDAIKDGVDIISISIGLSSLMQSDYLNDPIAIGAFHAEQRGVMVVCSAGNDGPDPYTVVNTAPWIFTVAASNIDRNFQSTLVLGNGKSFIGAGINFSNLTSSTMFPLVFGDEIAAKFTPTSEARNCYPGSLDYNKVAGKIVVCVNDDPNISRRIKKLVLQDARAMGMILVDENNRDVSFDAGAFPFTEIGNLEGHQILQYINSTKNPTATILPTIEVPRYRPAPIVASFSSRGPSSLTENILKPDVMAPGVSILAAMVPKSDEPGSVPIGKKPSLFGIKSGTSMACPHVSGAAEFIKSVHGRWTPSMIKSALMTTATTYNNLKKPVTNSSNYISNPHEMGVGEINPLKALNPGLVFETNVEDYIKFLCYYGYSNKIIRSMSKTNVTCPKTSQDLISNINYPSISIETLKRNQKVKVITRTVTNVGTFNATYVAKVHAPEGLVVKVIPNKLVFSERVQRLTYKVSFYAKEAHGGYNFGSLTWLDGRHYVHTVFAVKVE